MLRDIPKWNEKESLRSDSICSFYKIIYLITKKIVPIFLKGKHLNIINRLIIYPFM